jgi:DNA-binding transcriptional ArsR family regulator
VKDAAKLPEPDMLSAALSYAGMGIPVFPVNGKVPITKRGFHDATTDRAQIEAWWTSHPSAGIGTAAFDSIDVDLYKPNCQPTWDRIKPLIPDDTPQHRTGGGGFQFLFEPGTLRDGKIGPGVDNRYAGRNYIVLPPSPHPSGKRYEVVLSLTEGRLRPAPDFPHESGDAGEFQQLLSQMDAGERIMEGRNKATWWRAVEILRTLPENADLEPVEAVVQSWVKGNCGGDLREIDVAKQVRGAAKFVANERTGATRNSFPPPVAPVPGERESEQAAELPFSQLGALLSRVPAEPSWAVRGYLARFAITLLAGRPKVGKSTLICAMLAAVVGGRAFVGQETTRGGVLLLTEERRDTLAEKARTLGLIPFRRGESSIGGGDESGACVHALMRHDAGAVPWPEVVRQAMAHCAQHDLTTLVVDTFDRWTGLRGDAENAAGAVNEALEPLQYAAAAGLAVLLVSHQRKASGEFGEAVRGSTALTGGVDIVLELERPSRALQLGGQARVVRAVSRFSSTPEELFVELEEHGFAAIASPEQARVEAERGRVLSSLGEEPVAAQAVAEELKLPSSTVRRHLRTLLDRGAVERVGAGRKNDPYTWRVVEAASK